MSLCFKQLNHGCAMPRAAPCSQMNLLRNPTPNSVHPRGCYSTWQLQAMEGSTSSTPGAGWDLTPKSYSMHRRGGNCSTWQLQAMEGSTSSTPGAGWGYSVRGSYLLMLECTPAQ